MQLIASLFISTMATTHHPPNAPILLSFPATDALVESLASFVAKAQKDAIDKRGKFTVAISGGSLPKMLRGLIDDPSIKWKKWFVTFINFCSLS